MSSAAVALVTVAAVAGFGRVFSGPGWLGPVMLTAGCAHLAATVVRRRRVPPSVAVLASSAATALVVCWSVVGSSTTWGLPLAPTWRAVGAALGQAAVDFPNSTAPVATTTGFVLAAAVGAGVVALLGDWAATRLLSPMQAVAPGVALFVVCSIVGTQRGRLWSTAVIVGASAVSVLLLRATGPGMRLTPFGDRRRGAGAWVAGLGSAAAATAMVAAAVAVPLLPAVNGRGVLGWRGPGGGNSNRSVPSPVVELPTRLLAESATEVFTVRSPVASYWRLTSLDTFTGIQWESTNSYRNAARSLPGLQPAAAGARPVVAQFHIQDLSSIWLPTAFAPETISGGGKVSWDASSGSLLAARATSNGLDYQLTSLQYLSTVTAAQLAGAGSLHPDAGTARNTKLPATVGPRVRALAHAITAGSHNEYEAALALQDYFVSNPAFSYSLQPPSDGYGIDALSRFLFETRVGYCQQFAGAFAVLARAVGLPTRLAIGFTTGTEAGDGTYQVRNANAHTWPEVWFGPGLGWLPFEPTKGGGFAIPGATGYTGDTSRATPAPVPSPTSTVTTPPVSAAPRPVPAALPRDPVGAATAPLATPHGRTPWAALAVPVLVLLATAWLAVNLAVRRWRWWRRRRDARGAGADGGGAEVLVAWEEVVELLSWWGLRRRADETRIDLARRALPRLRMVLAHPTTAPGVVDLAVAATAADYSSGALSPSRHARAAAVGEELRSGLLQAAPLSLRLRSIADPRRAWRNAPVEATGAPGPAALSMVFDER